MTPNFKFEIRPLAALACLLMAGCLDGQYMVTDQDPGGPVIPPILLLVNYQAHLLTIQGVESNARWDNVTTELTPAACHHDAPTAGRMVPGQVVHFTAAASSTDTVCTFTASYDGHELDSWIFTIPAGVEASS